MEHGLASIVSMSKSSLSPPKWLHWRRNSGMLRLKLRPRLLLWRLHLSNQILQVMVVRKERIGWTLILLAYERKRMEKSMVRLNSNCLEKAKSQCGFALTGITMMVSLSQCMSLINPYKIMQIDSKPRKNAMHHLRIVVRRKTKVLSQKSQVRINLHWARTWKPHCWLKPVLQEVFLILFGRRPYGSRETSRPGPWGDDLLVGMVLYSLPPHPGLDGL